MTYEGRFDKTLVRWCLTTLHCDSGHIMKTDFILSQGSSISYSPWFCLGSIRSQNRVRARAPRLNSSLHGFTFHGHSTCADDQAAWKDHKVFAALFEIQD